MKGSRSVKSYLECCKSHVVSNSDGHREYQKADREVYGNSSTREVSNRNKDLVRDCAWSSSNYAVVESVIVVHTLGTWREAKFKGNRLINFVEKTSRQPRIQIGTWIFLPLFNDIFQLKFWAKIWGLENVIWRVWKITGNESVATINKLSISLTIEEIFWRYFRNLTKFYLPHV